MRRVLPPRGAACRQGRSQLACKCPRSSRCTPGVARFRCSASNTSNDTPRVSPNDAAVPLCSVSRGGQHGESLRKGAANVADPPGADAMLVDGQAIEQPRSRPPIGSADIPCSLEPSSGAARDPDSALDYGTCRYECDAEKGLIYGATVRFSDSAALRLRRRAVVMWDQDTPKRVLIVKKPIPEAGEQLLDIATWLEGQGVQVFVEPLVHAREFPQFAPFDPHVTEVDFGITLGGDGTVLYLSALFDEDVPLPPVICFAMGTLGFLTPFDVKDFRAHLSRVLAANVKPLFCTLRTRKCCEVLSPHGNPVVVHHVLNECVIDRGAFPGAVYLELYIDGGFVTAVEADGLIIATPSGSTAYSMSAGGSMVAPSVPCTLLTPLSPHSLSFRPLIIPESSDIVIRVPPSARSHARASFDGKRPMKIPRGCHIRFTSSLSPLPTINIGHLDFDWYEGITQKLKWNQVIRAQPAGTAVGTPLQEVLAAQGFTYEDEACLLPSGSTSSSSSNGHLSVVESSLEELPPGDLVELGPGAMKQKASGSVDLWCTSHYSEDTFYQQP